ncbi:PEP-CTERM sorting domain-containing protein [Rhodocyclus tenuis]|uniref:PEP-CTERM sorting domain-containing protein n=1 Tax=Rhodocyclus tenuis TaxID=1066 RepID=UPI001F5BA0A7|nr:PEP-CTERM sorting domain-containing protein [Rhodocyclus tenuis]MBK1678957.1 hypothetical protein [Rhodocyclus tenuis]
MNFKLKMIAAAAAMVVAGGANATMDNFMSGNSSLAFIALDSVGTPISLMADLDFNVNSFNPTAGTTIVWNFNTNSLTVNGVASASTQTNWSGAYSSFASLAQSADTKWAVIAGDSLSSNVSGDQRYLTTAAPGTTLATLRGQTKINLQGWAAVDLLVNANNALQTDSNASTATSGQAYVGTNTSNGQFKWNNKFVGNAFASEGATASFYQLDTNNGTATNRALVTPFAGTFSYASGVLTYAVAAVPEPETYAMLLAGLGMLGFMARRRLGSRA